MSDFFNRVDSDLTGILGHFGQTATIRGQVVCGGITRPQLGNEPVEGGAWDEYDGTFYTRLALLTEGVPVQGETITIEGKDVTVGRVKTDAACPLVTIAFKNDPVPK